MPQNDQEQYSAKRCKKPCQPARAASAPAQQHAPRLGIFGAAWTQGAVSPALHKPSPPPPTLRAHLFELRVGGLSEEGGPSPRSASLALGLFSLRNSAPTTPGPRRRPYPSFGSGLGLWRPARKGIFLRDCKSHSRAPESDIEEWKGTVWGWAPCGASGGPRCGCGPHIFDARLAGSDGSGCDM